MKFFGNVTKLEAEIASAEKAIQPDLEKAGITTALRDGKVIPIGEATLTEKYSALRAAQPTGTDLEHRSKLLDSNQVISDRLAKAESDLAIAQTSVGTLTRENATLKTDLETERASVKTLTGEKSNEINLRDAAVKQNAALEKEMAAQKTALAQRCLAANCLDLKDAKGKEFSSDDAGQKAKMEAAEKLSFDALFAAYNGAVNSAIAKTGVSFAALPSAVPGGTQASAPKFKSATELCAAAVQAKAQGKPVPQYESIPRRK